MVDKDYCDESGLDEAVINWLNQMIGPPPRSLFTGEKHTSCASLDSYLIYMLWLIKLQIPQFFTVYAKALSTPPSTTLASSTAEFTVAPITASASASSSSSLSSSTSQSSLTSSASPSPASPSSASLSFSVCPASSASLVGADAALANTIAAIMAITNPQDIDHAGKAKSKANSKVNSKAESNVKSKAKSKLLGNSG